MTSFGLGFTIPFNGERGVAEMRKPMRTVSILRAFVLGSALLGAVSLAGAAPVVIKLWDQHIHDKKFRQNIFKEFNKDNPDIKVEYTSQIGGTYPTLVDASFRSGTPPDIFVTTGVSVPLAKMVEMGWLMPLEDVAPSAGELSQWLARFPPGQKPFLDNVNMISGKVYSWPVTGQAGRMMLFYNTKLFLEAGLKGADGGAAVPETWDDMRTFARKITELGQGKVYGIVHGVKNNRMWDEDIFTSIAPAGGWPLVETFFGPGFDLRTGLYNYHHPAFRGAVQLWLDMKKDGSILPGDMSMDDEVAKFKFAQDLAGMQLGGYWNPGGYLAINSDLQFDLVLPPTIKSGVRLGYASVVPIANNSEYVVSSKTRSKEAVWKVIQFMTSQHYQEEWVKAGGGISAFPEYNKTEFFPHPSLAKVAQMGVTGRKAVPEFPAGLSKVWEYMETVLPGSEDTMEGVWIGKLGMDAFDVYERRINQAVDNALVEARKVGVNLTRADFTYPDWDPTKDYLPKSGKK